MKKNILKKIILSIYLITFLFGLFVPFNTSLAEDYLTLSANKTDVKLGENVQITAEVKDFLLGQISGGETILFTNSQTCTLPTMLGQVPSCSITFLPLEGTNILSANIELEGTSFPSNTLTITTNSIKQLNTTNKWYYMVKDSFDSVLPDSGSVLGASSKQECEANKKNIAYLTKKDHPEKGDVLFSKCFEFLPVEATEDGRNLVRKYFSENQSTIGTEALSTIETPVTVTDKGNKNITTNTTYTPLAPLPNLEKGVAFETDPAKNSCPFGKYLNIIIKLVIGFATVLAMIMIISGGLEYMTSELVSSKGEGKERIMHAVLGLLIALGSYLILNTINPALLNACLDNFTPAEIVINDSIPQTAINGKYCTNTTGGPYASGADWATIAGEIKTLPSGFVSNHPGKDCATVGEQNCTSLRKLDTSILEKIKAKCTNCGTITVTAGTECWLHGGADQSTTHHPNSATVDLGIASNQKLNEYIRSGTQKGSWYEKDGIFYLSEGDHWHVSASKK